MPRFEHDGISHYYTRIGEGFPLVFIHGLGVSHQNWIGQTPLFGRHFTVITYDCRGHGGTGSSQGPITIRTLSEDLHALLKHVGANQAVLVGYSSGTLIAENFALDHPDMVAGMCLIGSHAKIGGVYMTLKTQISKWMVQTNLHKALAYLVATHNAENLIQRGFFFRIAKRVDPAEAMRIMEASERFYTTEDLTRIECPLLLVHGSKDRATEAYGKDLAAKMPNARIAVVEGVNHAVATRATRAFNLLLHEWLGTLTLATEKELQPT